MNATSFSKNMFDRGMEDESIFEANGAFVFNASSDLSGFALFPEGM